METFDFVRDKLSEWGLSEWTKRFEDEDIDKESFLGLEDLEIKDLIPKIGPRTKFKKKLQALLQIVPSTSNLSDKGEMQGKSKLDYQAESSKQKKCTEKRHSGSGSVTSSAEVNSLAEVKEIMKCVQDKLDEQRTTKLNAFLKDKINDLETGKKQLVGVFGKTGAGKSSLINAIIGEKDLLPSGDLNACTSVMIKVEANTSNSKYMAEIEFIKTEEWKDELLFLTKKYVPEEEENEDCDYDYDDNDEKISALYGKEMLRKSPEELMDSKHFREIPEFLKSRNKILIRETASALSEELAKYTRSDKKDTGRQYWPLVKCVTIKVPNVSDLLEHVTLVDLPGSGDCNKSRDEMWKWFVGSCSAVWIVNDTNRAAADQAPWDILDNTISLMGNGGQCQSISFICTKSDDIGDTHQMSKEHRHARIIERNVQAKEQVKVKFNKQNMIKKHFSGDFFQVFTVSAREFQREQYLQKDETEIPKLQKVLQNLNDHQSRTANYISEAYGILSLIQGANCSKMAYHKPEVCKVLEQRLMAGVDEVSQSMEKAYTTFTKCLSEGVKKSQESYQHEMRSILVQKGKKDRGFHATLKSLVENGGIYKPKKKKRTININEILASCMRDHIDEEFKNTFPNEGRCGAFKGVIKKFTLDTMGLADKYKDVSLQLIFLKTEEAKLKTTLDDHIHENKKQIYYSLTNSIKESMQPCYEKAAQYRGKEKLKNMRDTIEKHLNDSKSIMFNKAMEDMLCLMKSLMNYILKTMQDNLKKSIELSLMTDDNSIPDVTKEYEKGKICYDKVMSSSNKDTPMTCVEPLKPQAAFDFQTYAQDAILKTMQDNLKKSTELSLMTDDNSIPDVTKEYEKGKICYDNVMSSFEPLKPEAAFDFQPMTYAQAEPVDPGADMKPETGVREKSFTGDKSLVSCVKVLSPCESNEIYRLDCPGAGLFQCASTGLVFEMVKKGEVHYWTVDWDIYRRTLTPAGPLFNIECPQDCVRQLHLPHCEILSDDPGKLLVAHVTDGKMEKMEPNRVTTTHVIVNVTNLSLYGLIKKWFSFQPVQSQVLLFHRTAANRPQTCMLNVLLLPRNVPISEVESHQRGCTFIQTSSNCTLSPKGRYGLGCELVTRADIQPKSGLFDCDYGPNYHPTFQVILESKVENVRLVLTDRENNDQRVWESLVPLGGFEEPQRAPTLNDFVKKHRNALIQRVKLVLPIADDLLLDEVITDEMYSRISNAQHSQEQMRELLTYVCASGPTATSALYKALKKHEVFLVKDLECSHR